MSNAVSQKIDEINDKILARSLHGEFSERLYCFQSYLFEQELLGKINMKLEPKAKIQ